MAPATRNNRGKDQIHWSEGVWKALDCAVMEEMRRTRVAAKFLPHVYVDRKTTTVPSDIVNVPGTPGAPPVTGNDFALSVDESRTDRIQEYWTTFKLSVAQVEEEEHEEMAMGHDGAAGHTHEPAMAGPDGERATAGLHLGHMSHPHRASTAVSLALRTANILAQAEDLVLLNGQNAVVNAPLFVGQGPAGVKLVSSLDPRLGTDLDLGLLNIQAFPANTPSIPGGQAANVITLPLAQVIAVHPVPANELPPGVPGFPPLYRENTLNAVAAGFSVLQGLTHYENYALVLHTYPYADLHQALPNTLIEPVEPVSHLVQAGIYGTGTLPPFTPVTQAGAQLPPSGLPTFILQAAQPGQAPTPVPLSAVGIQGNVLYTGVLVSLSGNTMDMVRGHMEDHKDVIVTFNQKDADEQYRFRTVQRFTLRLKDLSAVIMLLFMDS
jgi:hypothetical protein